MTNRKAVNICWVMIAVIAFFAMASGCSNKPPAPEATPVPSLQPSNPPSSSAAPTVEFSPSPVISDVPDSAEVLKIRELLTQGKFEEALLGCDKALYSASDNKTKSNILVLRAGILKHLKQPDRAKADIIEASKLNPAGEQPDLFLAIHIYSTGDMEYEAYDALHRAIDKLEGKDISYSRFFEGPVEKQASAYLMAGRICHDCGKYKESLPYLDKAVELQKKGNIPLSASADRAFTLFKLGRIQEARKDASYWLKNLFPKLPVNTSFEDCTTACDMFTVMGDHKKAFLYLEKSDKLAPKTYSHGTYHISKGRIYFSMGRFDKAQAEFDIVKSKYAGDEKILDMPDLRRMEKVIKKNPLGGAKERIKADAFESFLMGDMKAIVSNYSRLISEYPSDPEKAEWLMKRAGGYIGLKNFKEAEADLREVIKIGKMGATPYLMLAVRVYSENEEDAKAWECLEKAFKIMPDIEKDPFFIVNNNGKMEKSDSRVARFYMVGGILANDLGHYEKGLELFTKAISYGDIDDALHLALLEKAMILFKLEKYDEAKKLAKQWLDMKIYDKPDHYIAYQELADANMMAGNYDTAIEYIDKAIGMKPDDFGFYINKGRIYFRKGDYKKARQCLAVTRKHSAGEKWDFVELNRLEKLLKN